ncbi:MAG: sulfatase [Planctomycetota bacterium]|nr:sulfatase [Planctomycetota bacterium]
MQRHHVIGVALGIVLAVGLAIWQPWKATHLGRGAARTIVLFSIDALRRDHVGAYTPGGTNVRAATPRMDALAAKSVRFEDARTAVPLTLPSHVTMLAGLMPAETGVRVNAQPLAGPEARRFPLIQEQLKKAGWKTAAFVSAETLHPKYGLDAGFDVYDAEGLPPGGSGGLAVPERKGDDTVAAALRYVASLGEDDRVFLFVHIFEPHYPWAPTYREDCEDADRILGRFLDGLRQQGRGNARVLLTADHGEALGELGEKTHGILLSDGSMRVPLIIHVPGRDPGVRMDPVTVADLAPTIAELAGVHFDRPESAWGARSLVGDPLPADRPRVAESLYGHHRFRWAQLTAAVLPGGQLVDAGADRAHWLPVQPFGEDLAGTLPGTEVPADATLFRTLSDYRSSEDSGAMAEAYGISGYGAGGVVTPFLPGPENARLPDPHLRAAIADDLSELALATAVARHEEDALRLIGRLVRMADADPGNPEIWFRLGKARHKAALLRKQAGLSGDRQAERAEAAFQKAWEAGRRDEGTLILWVGANAEGREAAMCERLETYAAKLGPSFQLALLEAILLRARIEAGEPGLEADRKAACEEAQALAKSERDRERLAKAGCR